MRASIVVLLFALCFNIAITDINFRQLMSNRKYINKNSIDNIISVVSNLWRILNQPINLDALVSKLVQIGDRLTQTLYPPPELPHIPQDTWWGDDHSYRHHDTSIRPFRINFNPDRIHRLIHKLKYRENFTKPLKGAAMTYGTDANFLDHILDYWQMDYDFAVREHKLNVYPQFKTNIQGLDIHFVHIKPEARGKKVIPILLLHGWPRTNMEYLDVFPLLTNARHDYDFVFEVIAPSIPGFGYSQGTSKIGLSHYQVGILFKNLMARLGFKRFYIHGGDFGEFIASTMVVMYPKDILGFHTNLPCSFMPNTFVKYAIGGLQPTAVVQKKYIERIYPISARLYIYITKTGYFHEHATQPDSLGKGLEDSPSGLASWIGISSVIGSNPSNLLQPVGNMLHAFDIDKLLDVLTIMWDSECITTSMRIYAETTAVVQDPTILKILWNPTPVPYAAIKFRHEIIYQPDNFLKDKYPNLVHSKTLDFGGHFAAEENPKVLSDNIWESVKKMIDFHQNI